jgi:hypothetical protein
MDRNFFLRLKVWQLELLVTVSAFFPAVIFITWFIGTASKQHEANPSFMMVFAKMMALSAALQATVFYLWRRTTSRYLHDLLNGSDGEDFEKYKTFYVVEAIIAFAVVVICWTGYVFLAFFYLVHHPWLLVPLFMLWIARNYFLRDALFFRSKTCEALLREVAYHSVKAPVFFQTFNKRWSFPQDEIRQVYLKYGDIKSI